MARSVAHGVLEDPEELGEPGEPDVEIPGAPTVTVSTGTEADASGDTGMGRFGVGLTAGVGIPETMFPVFVEVDGGCGRVTVISDTGPPAGFGRVMVTTGPDGFSDPIGAVVTVEVCSEPRPVL